MNDKIKKNLEKIDHLLAANQYAQAKSDLVSMALPRVIHHAVLATICLKEGDLQQAEVLFSKSLEEDPNYLVALGNFAQLLVLQKRFKNALEYAEKSYKAAPKNQNYALNYATCLAETDKCSDAIQVLMPFLNPDKPKKNVLIAIASLLRADLRPNEATDLLNKYVDKFGDDPDFQRGLAETYSETDPHKASEYFHKIIDKLPDSLQLKWNWSFVELRLRNFQLGWELYESGLTDAIGKVGRPIPPQAKLVPMKTDINQLDKNKWTLFVNEQGIGDQILFLGCMNQVFKDYPKSILICEERMLPILRRSFPGQGVYTFGFVNVLSKQLNMVNGIFPVGSLQKYYRFDTAQYLNNQSTYVAPNPELMSSYREKIKQLVPNKKLVGLSWRGGFWDRQIRTKSFDFEMLEPLMQKKDVQYVSLQYGDIQKERDLAKEKGWPITFVDGIDFKKDLDSWVALGAACDEILSVSTALVHFMAAAGKKVNLMLSDKQSPFIWGLEDGWAIPYQQVFIHRKKVNEDLTAYVRRVSEGLA